MANGVLDFMSDPANQGLLSLASGLLQAGGPSRTPVGFGQALGMAGEQGIGAYNVASELARKRMETQGMLQAAGLKLAAAQRQQENVNAFANTLPEADRVQFLADPAAYMKARYAKTVVSPGQTVLTNGAPSFSLPAAPTLVDAPVPNQPGVTQPTWVRPGESGGVEVGGQKMPEILNPAVQQARKDIAGAGRPSIDVRVDNRMGGSVAEQVGPMAAASKAAAVGAIQSAMTADRITNALSSDNVNLGPTATIRQKADQVAQLLGIGGKDTEQRLVNTRNVIRGLAQSAVNARAGLKGQGQISDYEGKLLQRAEAGEIDDFTIPELRDFAALTRKIARLQYEQHQTFLGKMRENEGTRGAVPFYEVQPFPEEGGWRDVKK